MKNLLIGFFMLLATAVTAQTYQAKVVSNTAAVINNYEGFRVTMFGHSIWDGKYVYVQVEGKDEKGSYLAYAALNENLLVGSNPIRTGDIVSLIKYPKKVGSVPVDGMVIVCTITGKVM